MAGYCSAPHRYRDDKFRWAAEEFRKRAEQHPTTTFIFVKVKSHSGIPGNDRADELAKATALDTMTETPPAHAPLASDNHSADPIKISHPATALDAAPPPTAAHETEDELHPPHPPPPPPAADLRQPSRKEYRGQARTRDASAVDDPAEKIMRQASLWQQWKNITNDPGGRLGRTYFFINGQTDLTHFLKEADGPHHPAEALNQSRSNECWAYLKQIPEAQRIAFARARCADLPTRDRNYKWNEALFPSLNCLYCQNRRNPDGSNIRDTEGHWLSGVCGAPGCTKAGLLRHTNGCKAVATLIDEGLTGARTAEWEYHADIEFRRPPESPSRSNPISITESLPEDLRSLAPDHVLIRWHLNSRGTRTAIREVLYLDNKFSEEKRLNECDQYNRTKYEALRAATARHLQCIATIQTIPVGARGCIQNGTIATLRNLARRLRPNQRDWIVKAADRCALKLIHIAIDGAAALVELRLDTNRQESAEREKQVKAGKEGEAPPSPPPSPPPPPRARRRTPRTQLASDGEEQDPEGPTLQPGDEEVAIANLTPRQQQTYRTYREAQTPHELALAAAKLTRDDPPQSQNPYAEEILNPDATTTAGKGRTIIGGKALTSWQAKAYQVLIAADLTHADALQLALSAPEEEPPDTEPSLLTANLPAGAATNPPQPPQQSQPPPPPRASEEPDERPAKRSCTQEATTPPQPPPPQEQHLSPPPPQSPHRHRKHRAADESAYTMKPKRARNAGRSPAPSPAATPRRRTAQISGKGTPHGNTSSDEPDSAQRPRPAGGASPSGKAARGGGHGNSARKRRARGARHHPEAQSPAATDRKRQQANSAGDEPSYSGVTSDVEGRVRRLGLATTKFSRRRTGGVGRRGNTGGQGTRSKLWRLAHPRDRVGEEAREGGSDRGTRGEGAGRRQAAAAGAKRPRETAEETGERGEAGHDAEESGLRRGARRRLGDDQVEGREGAEGATDRRGFDGRGGSSDSEG